MNKEELQEEGKGKFELVADCPRSPPSSLTSGSHGISVGSLGQYAGETDIVANVFVKK